jgi:hypothetical protein
MIFVHRYLQDGSLSGRARYIKGHGSMEKSGKIGNVFTWNPIVTGRAVPETLNYVRVQNGEE